MEVEDVSSAERSRSAPERSPAHPESTKRPRVLIPLPEQDVEPSESKATVIDLLKHRWIGRSNEIDRLFEFLSARTTSEGYGAPTELMVIGSATTGKTCVVTDVVATLGLKYAYVCAAQCNGKVREAITVVASQISAAFPATMPSVKAKQCKSVEALASHIERCVPLQEKAPFVLIVDDADDYDMVEAAKDKSWQSLINLGRRTRRNLRVIFIGRTVVPSLTIREVVNFSPLGEEDFKRVLMQRLSLEITENEVSNGEELKARLKTLLRMVSTTYSGLITDFDDLSFIVSYLWQAMAYSSKIDGATSSSSKVALGGGAASTKKSKPFLIATEHLNRRLFHRDCEALPRLLNKVGVLESGVISWSQSEISKKLDSIGDREVVGAAELPFFGKVLLVAFYMASYNPADFDSILFGGKKKRRSRKKRASTATAEDQSGAANSKPRPGTNDIAFVGPKTLSLERGRWLFRALLTDLRGSAEAEKAAFGIHRYLESLVSLRLVVKCTDERELSDIKYKCVAGKSFCEAVARNLGLDLDKYLASSAIQ